MSGEQEAHENQELILVVDDNQNIVKLIQVNLEYEGYETIPAYDGEDALEKVRQYSPSLIILDVLMPYKTGWEVLEVLKSQPETASIPVIMLTAMGQKSDLKRGWEGGVEDYLTKPFNPMSLISAVRRVFEKVKERVQEKETTVSHIRPGTGVAIMGGGERGLKILQSLLGNPSISILGVADPNLDAPAMKLAKDMRLFTTKDPGELLNRSGLDLLIEAAPGIIPRAILSMKPAKVEILSGFAMTFMWNLLEEKESSEEKVRALLKDLYALYEASKGIGAQIDLPHTVDTILFNMVTAVDADAGAFMLEEDREFVVQAERGGLWQKGDYVLKEKVSTVLTEIEVVGFFPFDEKLLDRFPGIRELKKGSVALVVLSSVHSSGVHGTAKGQPFKEQRTCLAILHFNSRSTLSQDERTFLSTLAAHAGIAIENAILYQSAKEKQAMVEDLLSKVIDAQEEERKRIAGEIHDSVAQTLVSMLTKVQTCETYCKTNPKIVPSELEELRKVMADAVKETRQILFNLRPSTLDDLGLIPTLENYLKKFESETKIHTEFVLNNFTVELSPHVETIVYRMVQEALANVKKHAAAKNVKIILTLEESNLHLLVSDDGVGFEMEGLRRKIGKTDSMGLTGMMERAAYLGGALTLNSAPGHGTTLSVNIPVTYESNV